MDANLQHALSHVLWIGGATDSGKTTVSDILFRRHDIQVYDYDQQDLRQTTYLAQTNDYYRNFLNASDEEVWVRPEPEDLLKHVLQVFADRFPLVLEDLLDLPNDRPIIAEGFGFMPEIVHPLLSNKHEAIWFLPTEEFKWKSMRQRTKYTRRLQMSNPERAINNLFVRDMLLAEKIREEAQQRGLEVSVVDGSRSSEEMADLVENHFRPFLQTNNNRI